MNENRKHNIAKLKVRGAWEKEAGASNVCLRNLKLIPQDL